MNNENGSAFPKASGFITPEILPKESTIEIFSKDELQLDGDELDHLKRKILMGTLCYGVHQPKLIASFSGISQTQILSLIADKDSWLNEEIKKGTIPCWTKGELIARLCIEAEHAETSRDRLAAITKIMEFRGLATPEGGSKSFTRVISRYMNGQK